MCLAGELCPSSQLIGVEPCPGPETSTAEFVLHVSLRSPPWVSCGRPRHIPQPWHPQCPEHKANISSHTIWGDFFLFGSRRA